MSRAESFLQELKTHESHIAFMYYSLFSILEEENLNNTIDRWEEDYKEHPDEWFWMLHKEIRQVDWFMSDGIRAYRQKSLLTPQEDRRRRDIIFQIVMTDGELEPELKRELKDLNTKFHHKKEFEITGKLDSLLWNLIHIDEKQILHDTLIKYFK